MKFYNPALAKDDSPQPGDPDYVEKDPYAELKFVQMGMHSTVRMVMSQPAPPETFEGGYSKKSEKSGGITALMDKLIGELEVELSDMEHEEKTAVEEEEEEE